MKKLISGVLALMLTFGSLCLPEDLIRGWIESLTVSAVAYETYGDFEYRVSYDEAILVRYTGNDTCPVIQVVLMVLGYPWAVVFFLVVLL